MKFSILLKADMPHKNLTKELIAETEKLFLLLSFLAAPLKSWFLVFEAVYWNLRTKCDCRKTIRSYVGCWVVPPALSFFKRDKRNSWDKTQELI